MSSLPGKEQPSVGRRPEPPQPQPSAIGGRESDSEGWETEDEELVHVELSGIFQDDLRRDPNLLKRFFGLETNEPLVQIGANQVFSGNYNQTPGTSVFFLKNEEPTPEEGEEQNDPLFSNRSNKLEYLCKADTKLVLKRVFLKKRPAAATEPAAKAVQQQQQ